MSAAAPDRAALLQLLPEGVVGVVEQLEPIRAGLSGAHVYAVQATRGQYVLRVQERMTDPGYFAAQLLVLQRAAAAGIAPAVAHVDEAALAVVSTRIRGVPIAMVLADPAQRGAVLASVVEQLRALHALDPAGVPERDPLPFAREEWTKSGNRSGFPPWADGIGGLLLELEKTMAEDPRRVVSHNDVNPGNFLWDGSRAWLVDWEVSGLTHPYYDLATLAVFLRMDEQLAFALVESHDGAPLDERGQLSFKALHRLSALLCGLTFLGLVGDLLVRPAPTLQDAPALADVFAGMRTGQVDLQTAHGQASMGLALLAVGVRGLG